MPLSERARIEAYLPVQPKKPVYERLLDAFEREFIHTFGGCTVVKNTEGKYLSADGEPVTDKINLVYADAPFDFVDNFEALSDYADELKKLALRCTDEESILIVVHRIYHSV